MARMIERPPVHDTVRQVYWPAVPALPESDTHGLVGPVAEPDKRADLLLRVGRLRSFGLLAGRLMAVASRGQWDQ
jgi:hypothetical protein